MQDKIIVTLEDGKTMECDVLAIVENNKNKYIIYTDYEKENGQVKLYASCYDDLQFKINLYPIEKEEEWQFLESKINEIRESIDK